MGGKTDRVAGRATKTKPASRGRDSEGEESETSAMSGTSSDKRRLAQTREGLREAGAEALRMAAAHETPTEAPTIFGPGNVLDAGDDEKIEELRTRNAELVHRLRMHSATGAATSKRATWTPNSLRAMSSDAPALANERRRSCK